MEKHTITIHASIQAPLEQVWDLYTAAEHVVKWNQASEDWHTPRAENDLRPGGKFLYRMEAKVADAGFDFWGTYDEVKPHQLITYTLGDERKVSVAFSKLPSGTVMEIQFDAESTNSMELQRRGWQAILDNFKKYAEEKTNDHR
jgi:uncharacterized protein YndB with AHSA1/START domain